MNTLVEKLKPLSDWILVKRDPPQPRSSIIIDPGNEGSNVRTGTVLRTGPGKTYEGGVVVPLDVEPGDRIAFLRWHHEHRPGKINTSTLRKIADEFGVDADVVLVRENDILFVFEGDVRIDV